MPLAVATIQEQHRLAALHSLLFSVGESALMRMVLHCMLVQQIHKVACYVAPHHCTLTGGALLLGCGHDCIWDSCKHQRE